jgi:hypothetical protein
LDRLDNSRIKICDIETSDVIWTITPKCGHSGKAEVWGRQNDFNGPITVGQNMNEIYKQNKSYEKNKCYYPNVA